MGLRRAGPQPSPGDALGAHDRDELGIFKDIEGQSASGRIGVGRQLLAGRGHAAVGDRRGAPLSIILPPVAGASLASLALLGGLAARAGGASVLTGALRVLFWGAIAMAVTAGIGGLRGTVV